MKTANSNEEEKKNEAADSKDNLEDLGEETVITDLDNDNDDNEDGSAADNDTDDGDNDDGDDDDGGEDDYPVSWGERQKVAAELISRLLGVDAADYYEAHEIPGAVGGNGILVSDENGDLLRTMTDQEEEKINSFQALTGNVVFHVVKSSTSFGELLNFIFLPPESSLVYGEMSDGIRQKTPYVFVYNETFPQNSEYGHIKISRERTCLKRIA